MERNARTKKLKIAIIAIALLLCFALAVGITTAFYQAQRRAMGSVKMDQGIIIDYKGFNKGDENIWQRETTTTFKLFEERDAQPGEQIYAYSAGIRANAESVDFYARLKLEYSFYNVVGDVETPVALANPKSLITTSSTFFDSNWVESTDGYYYYGAGTVLNKFSKDATNYIDIFAKDGEGNVVAQFLIEGANFVGETAGEGGGFVVEDTYINKIVVLLTLETLQGDADAEAEGWKITKSSDQTVDVSGETEADITIDDIISGDRDGEITIAGDPAQPLTITIGSKAFYGCTKLNLTLSNSENIIYQIASDAFSEGATIMYGTTDVSSLVINPSTSGKTAGAANRWQVAEPNLYLFLPSALTSTGDDTTYGDYQYTDDQGTWYFDLIDESGNKVSALSSRTSGGVSTLGASTLESTNNYTAKINYVVTDLTNLVIPTYIGSDIDSTRYVVTKLSYYTATMFSNRDYIETVVLPSQLKIIDWYVFLGAGRLQSVTIPESVTDIKMSAFENCKALTSITIPEGVKSIGKWAFKGCSNLSSITISSSVAEIGEEAFANNPSLTSIVVSSGNSTYKSSGNCLIETASKTLLTGCKTSNIPSDGSVEIIARGAFAYCDGLTSINIADSVKAINAGAFEYCTNLKTVSLPNSLTYIGGHAFGDTGLTSVTIPKNVTTIGSADIYEFNPFSGCSDLETISVSILNKRYTSKNNCLIDTYSKTLIAGSNSSVIPTDGSVLIIGEFAFSGLKIESLYIPAAVQEVKEKAIYLEQLTTLEIHANTVKSLTMVSASPSSEPPLENIIFGDEVVNVYVGIGAFSNLKSVYIGAGLKDLTNLLSENKNFKNINFEISADNPYLTITNSLLIQKQSGYVTIKKYLGDKDTLTTVELPTSVVLGNETLNVECIGRGLFQNCKNLTSVVNLDNIIIIGANAFENTNLTSINLGANLTEIGTDAFSGTALSSINIPDSVTYIGGGAFSSTALTSITIPDSVISLGDGGETFRGCTSLTSAVIGNGVSRIPYSCFYGCTSLGTVTLGSKVTEIGNSAFYDCSNLTTVIWNVTYDLGGVNATGPSLTQYNTSSTGGLSITDTLVAPTSIEDGYTFEGWSDGSTIYAAGSDYTFTITNRNLTAVWSKYKVSFDANGGEGSHGEIIVDKGNSIALPNFDNFTRDGYAALGWAVDKSATNADYQALASYTPTQSITLYVIWVKVNNDYTTGYTNLIFDLNGGIGKITFEGVYPTQYANITLPDISGVTKEGCIFLGWSINADNTNYYQAGQSVGLYSSNCPIIAVWHSPITVIITGNGGVGEDIVIAEQDGSSTINLDDYINSFTAPEGYYFTNWETNTGRTYSKGQTFNFLDYSETVIIKAVWAALYNDATTGYTNLKFDLNGGAGKVNFSGVYLGGAMITFPEITGVTKEGYVFVGWSNKQDGSGSIYIAGASSNWSANDTIYAVWSKLITINFDLNGGEGTVPSPITTAYRANYTINTGNAFTKEGYKFAGWTLVDAEGNEYATFGYNQSGTFDYSGENYTLKARWTGPTTVTFYNDDTKSQSFTMTGFFEADGLTFPDDQNIISKEGYVFIGWNTSANASWVAFEINSRINSISNTEFYAVWKTESECTKYVFDLSEVDGQANIVRVGYEGSFQISSIEILSTLRNSSGQLISGWTETQGSSNQDYSMTSWLHYGWYHGQTKTLYPIWVTPVTLTFDANGGEGDVPSPIETYYQGQFDIPAVSLTKEGYVFAGWAWESNATYSVYENGSTNNGYYESDGKSTLYAFWAVPRTLTFDSNGGQGEVPASISTYYEGRFDIPSVTLTKEGYTFLGWSFTKNLTSTYGSGDIYENGETDRGYYYNADKTLYAVWGKPVTITFDMNDGTGTSLGTVTVSFGESFNFPTKPSRTGYKFLGWHYKQNAGNGYWSEGTTSANSRFISGSVTIYAQWEVLNNQVYVGSLTESELAAIQAVWSGKSSLSQISDRTLIQSMYNNNIHSRFGVNVYLNDVKLGLNHTDSYNYGFSYDTNYAKLSTNTYVFEFENAMPTGWKLVNYRYEVQAQGDVTIVDGKARATVNYSYIESFADPSDNLFLMFVLPSAPEESTSVGINISAAPGNVIEKMVTGDSTFEWSYFLQTGFLIEIYDGENNLLWLGNPSSSNGGMVSYRFATGTYKLRIYTTNVVGFGIYSAADASLITGQDVSSVTHGDNYSEVTFNYTFADGNPDMILLFSMADVEVDAAKLQSLVTSFNMCGPDNVVGTWVTTLIKMMTGEDVPADELNYAGYMGMLYQNYFNGTIANIPNFSIYDSNGNEICSLSNITENIENVYIITRGATYTIKFASEVKNVFIADGDSIVPNELIPVSYNETTGTWDATVTAYDIEYMMFLVFTADIDLEAYEDLPQYDANEDYTGYLDF